MSLLGPIEVRELAERLGVNPTKKLGQNFVIDPNTVRKIVRLAGVVASDRVIEVGPGLGSLTLGLTEVGADVTAVEIDHRLAAELPHTVAAMQPEAVDRFRVVRSDALEVTAEQLAGGGAADPAGATTGAVGAAADPAGATTGAAGAAAASATPDAAAAKQLPEVLVANLPYNVSVPILMHLLELLPGLRSGLVMVQAEVGYRIAATPGAKEYGAPSAKAAWYGSWTIAGTVSRRIFWPVPGVDSVLVSYARAEAPLGSESEREKTFALVNAAFAGRRKMLRQSLQGVAGMPASTEQASEVITAAGVSPTARAEQLSIEQFLAIARELPVT